MKNKLTIGFLPGTDTIVIRKNDDSNIFILTTDSIIISRTTLLTVLNYLLEHKIISPKALEGILEEYYTE